MRPGERVEADFSVAQDVFLAVVRNFVLVRKNEAAPMGELPLMGGEVYALIPHDMYSKF